MLAKKLQRKHFDSAPSAPNCPNAVVYARPFHSHHAAHALPQLKAKKRARECRALIDGGGWLLAVSPATLILI